MYVRGPNELSVKANMRSLNSNLVFSKPKIDYLSRKRFCVEFFFKLSLYVNRITTILFREQRRIRRDLGKENGKTKRSSFLLDGSTYLRERKREATEIIERILACTSKCWR